MSVRSLCSLTCVIVLVVGCGGQGAELQTTAAELPPHEDLARIGDVHLHYLDWGGDGDLLLFVPGLGGTAYLWNGIAPHFRDRYRVVAVTPREHGASDKPRQTTDAAVLGDDLAGVVAHFSDGPAIVVGHSFAGVQMTQLARRHPSRVAGLVFLDALYDTSAQPEPPPAIPGAWVPDSVYASVDEAVSAFMDGFPTLQRELVEGYVGSQLRETSDGSFVWQLPGASPVVAGFAQLIRAWSPDELDGIEVPTLAIRIEQAAAITRMMAQRGIPPDSVAVARRWAEEWDDVWKRSALEAVEARIPGAATVVLEEGTHLLPLERPEIVVGLLDDFLTDRELR
jgi:pimeloyl-ACP methyl ester carboxylesterase